MKKDTDHVQTGNATAADYMELTQNNSVPWSPGGVFDGLVDEANKLADEAADAGIGVTRRPQPMPKEVTKVADTAKAVKKVSKSDKD